jgi:hypothetical protein
MLDWTRLMQTKADPIWDRNPPYWRSNHHSRIDCNDSGFLNCPRATATATLVSQCTHSTGAILELPPLVTGYVLHYNYSTAVKVKVQSGLVLGTHLGPATNFSHSLFEYFFDSCGFVDVGRPLWREVVSAVFSCCWASPAQPLSDLSPTGHMSIFYCLYFWDSPNLEGQGSPIIPPGIGALVVSFTPEKKKICHRILGPLSKSKSHYDRQSVGQSVLVSGAHLGPVTNFSIFLRFSLFVML